MTTAADHTPLAELEPPGLDESALADDILHEYGLASFPAGDPSSWWAHAEV